MPRSSERLTATDARNHPRRDFKVDLISCSVRSFCMLCIALHYVATRASIYKNNDNNNNILSR